MKKQDIHHKRSEAHIEAVRATRDYDTMEGAIPQPKLSGSGKSRGKNWSWSSKSQAQVDVEKATRAFNATFGVDKGMHEGLESSVGKVESGKELTKSAKALLKEVGGVRNLKDQVIDTTLSKRSGIIGVQDVYNSLSDNVKAIVDKRGLKWDLLDPDRYGEVSEQGGPIKLNLRKKNKAVIPFTAAHEISHAVMFAMNKEEEKRILGILKKANIEGNETSKIYSGYESQDIPRELFADLGAKFIFSENDASGQIKSMIESSDPTVSKRRAELRRAGKLGNISRKDQDYLLSIMSGIVTKKISSEEFEKQRQRLFEGSFRGGLVSSGYFSGGEISAAQIAGLQHFAGGGSTSGINSAALSLNGGINVARLYLGGKLAMTDGRSDRIDFMKELELQVRG